jgi:hypothetical protein
VERRIGASLHNAPKNFSIRGPQTAIGLRAQCEQLRYQCEFKKSECALAELQRRNVMALRGNMNQRSRSLMNYPAVFVSRGRTKLAMMLVVFMTCGVVAGYPAIAQDVPDATIELWGGSVAVGIGYTWGSANLIYQGKEYPLKVSGLSIVQVGAAKYTASGSVYHLTQPSDINGIYTSISVGAAVAGGASAPR